MKQYSRENWAKLTKEEQNNIIKTIDPKFNWCDEHQRWDSNWWPDASRPDGFVHYSDFGWTCGGCYRTSSDFPGVPMVVSFRLHKCSNIIGWNNILFTLFMTFVVILLALHLRNAI